MKLFVLDFFKQFPVLPLEKHWSTATLQNWCKLPTSYKKWGRERNQFILQAILTLQLCSMKILFQLLLLCETHSPWKNVNVYKKSQYYVHDYILCNHVMLINIMRQYKLGIQVFLVSTAIRKHKVQTKKIRCRERFKCQTSILWL